MTIYNKVQDEIDNIASGNRSETQNKKQKVYDDMKLKLKNGLMNELQKYDNETYQETTNIENREKVYSCLLNSYSQVILQKAMIGFRLKHIYKFVNKKDLYNEIKGDVINYDITTKAGTKKFELNYNTFRQFLSDYNNINLEKKTILLGYLAEHYLNHNETPAIDMYAINEKYKKEINTGEIE